MAAERKLTLKFQFVRGGQDCAIGSNVAVNADYATSRRKSEEVSVPTAWTALDVTGLSDIAELVLQNLDPTNYIQLATANDGTKIMARLKPGSAPIYFTPEPAQTWYVKAAVAACRLSYIAIEP